MGVFNCSYLKVAQELKDNKEQWEAYESKGHCAVIAGPGSGKTKVLTIKMARMLAEDVIAPRGIACLTFNNECVHELKMRLDRLGVEQGRRTFIGTVHSFCLQKVVAPFGRLAGLNIPDPLKVASVKEAQKLQRATIEKELDQNPDEWTFRFPLYRRRFLDREAAEWRENDWEAAQVIEAYEERLAKKGLVDFDGMVLTGLHLIERNAWVRKCLKAMYPILIVDEYQDLGYPLHRIVESLCFKAGIRLFAVGDPDQSIYGFTGAEPDLFRGLAQKDIVQDIELRLNYRCGNTILKASQVSLDEERTFRAANEHNSSVNFYECTYGIQEQVRKVCSELIPMYETSGTPLGSIAILYRDKFDGSIVSDIVEDAGYKYIRTDQGTPYKKTRVTMWLEDCAAWCSGGWLDGTIQLSSILRDWSSINQCYSLDQLRREPKTRFIKFLFAHRDGSVLLKEWLTDFLDCCLKSALKANSSLRDEAEAVLELYNACSNALGDMTVEAFGGKHGSTEHLRLSTFHSIKGLEFDVVIIVGAEEGKFPYYKAKTPQQIKEERRLFYVGLTRARYIVDILYSGWYEFNVYTFRNGVSRFVTELRDKLET